jgi:hypothetical protein
MGRRIFMVKPKLAPDRHLDDVRIRKNTAASGFHGARLLGLIVFKALVGVPMLGYATTECFRKYNLDGSCACPICLDIRIHNLLSEESSLAPRHHLPPCGGGQDWVEPSLRAWARSTKTHTTDQNYLCRDRYNRYVFCSSKRITGTGGAIPPANQTTAVWQMGIPKARRDVRDEPQSRRPYDDVQREIEADRDAVQKIVTDYQEDWCTQAELEDILRRPTRLAHVQANTLRSALQTGIRIGSIELMPMQRKKCDAAASHLTRLPAELDSIRVLHPQKRCDDWGDVEDYEDDFVRTFAAILPRTGDEDDVEGRFSYDPRTYGGNTVAYDYNGRSHNADDEDTSDDRGHDGDGISHGGMRETTGPVPLRRDWFAHWRESFNPEHLPPTVEAVEEIRAQPNFERELMRYRVMFGGMRINEVTAGNPNTLAKYFGEEFKTMHGGIDLLKTIGHYFVVVTLNGRAVLKILAPASAPFEQAQARKAAERKRSEANAAKYARKKARQDGLDETATQKRVAKAIERVRLAFEVPIESFKIP